MKPLKVARDLQRRRARERTGLFTAEGVRCVEELLASPLSIRSVILAPGLRDTERGVNLDSSIRAAAQRPGRGFEISEVSDADLTTAADTDTPQGVIAIAAKPERSFEGLESDGLFLLLDGVQDPGNVGTILRTARAFGVTATLALPGTADLWNPKVVRSAMGSLFSHRAFHATAEDALNFLHMHRIPLWATSAVGDSISLERGGGSLAIVVGNEGNGVSDRIAASAARTVAIPVRGVESLNVAVAAGILLHAVSTE